MTVKVYHTQYRKLERLCKQESDKSQANRYRIVISHYRHLSKTAISHYLGVARSTINRVLQRFNQEGIEGLYDKRHEQGPRKVTEEYVEVMLSLLTGSPRQHGWGRSTWTRELLALQLKKETGIDCHPTHVGRLLHDSAVYWKRAKAIGKKPVDKARKTRVANRIKAIRDNLGADEIMLYQDEVDIHLNPKIGPCWMPKGQQFEVETPGQNKKRYIYGGLNPNTGNIIWTESERKNADGFIEWLKVMSSRYRRYRKIHVVLDNYIIHKTKRVNEVVKSMKRICLHFLPPYSPELNPIERLWGDLHANVTRNHQCRDIDELMGQVRQFLGNAVPYPGNRPAMKCSE
jgi:putative transposase